MKSRFFRKIFIKENQLFQYLATYTGTLTMVAGGMHYAWPSPSLPQLLSKTSSIPITNEEGSWIAVMPLIGAIFGSIISAFICDKIGKKNVILFSTIPFFITWIMIALARSFAVLLSARLIAGIADGMASCALPMYLGEIASSNIRGILGSSVTVTWIFGILLINIIGSYLNIFYTALASSVIPVLCLITFWWMPESPYYFIMKKNYEQARNSLEIFHGVADVAVELERLNEVINQKQKNSCKWFDLFTISSNRKAIFIALGVRGFQQFSGISAVTFYAHILFEESSNAISPNVAAIIYFTIQLLFSGCCSMIVDRTGRKPLLIVSTVGVALVLLAQGLYFYAKDYLDVNLDHLALFPVIGMIAYIIIFSIGLQVIPILLLGELFPTNVKAFAVCLTDIIYSVAATSASKFFQIAKDSYGLYVPFFGFAIFCVFELFFIKYCVRETKGKTLEEIQLHLKVRK